MIKEIEITRLVNKRNLLSAEESPLELVIMDENENNFHEYADPTLKPTIDKRILPAFLELQRSAKEAEFNLIVDSGYRSYDYQLKILQKFIRENGEEYAQKFVAPPGTSEHQTGLAIDFAAFHDGVYSDTLSDDEKMWLENNAYKFGFILRYPEDKEDITGYSYEPWHFRYVGDLAIKLHDFDITLEEYYQNKGYYDTCDEEKKVHKR